MKVLSIDAWAEPEGGWSWNSWFTVGEITKEEFEKLDTNRKILKWFRQEYLSDKSVWKCGVDNDGYNIVITERSNNRPLFCIEFGPEYS